MRLPALVLASQVAQLLTIRLQCRRCGLDPLGREDPWRRAWQPSPVFLTGESHGQRSLVGYSPWVRKESDTTGRLCSAKLYQGILGSLSWGYPTESMSAPACGCTQPGTAFQSFPGLEFWGTAGLPPWKPGSGVQGRHPLPGGGVCHPRSLLRASFEVTPPTNLHPIASQP